MAALRRARDMRERATRRAILRARRRYAGFAASRHASAMMPPTPVVVDFATTPPPPIFARSYAARRYGAMPRALLMRHYCLISLSLPYYCRHLR